MRFYTRNSNSCNPLKFCLPRGLREMATMPIPARQPPQDQGDAATTGTGSAENGARSVAIAVQAVLATNRVDVNDSVASLACRHHFLHGSYSSDGNKGGISMGRTVLGQGSKGR